MTAQQIQAICDKVTARWTEESWDVARTDNFDGSDQDAITLAAEELGMPLDSQLTGIQEVYAELYTRAQQR